MITRIKNQEFESAGRLEVALEEYLVRRGMLDVDEWLGRFPDCTTELLEFLNNQIHIGPIAAAFSKPMAMPTCRIGDYEILEIVDRGGMGIVYKAYQRTLRRIVALKMIQQGQFCSPEVRRRFQNEAETAARLRHPNLVAIHEVGEHNGIPFFSMEFVKGRTLADLSRQGRIRPHVVARISQSIAETIHYIHSCGVLHRDLKPSNVMIDDHCEVRVTDFGLAKQLDRQYSLTEAGQILGSIDYMPPEQAEARHELMGPTSDVYSIGAIMFELLTGRPPFRCETFLETLRQIREQSPIRPTQLNPRVPAGLEAICLKCLHKKQSGRYQSAAELAEDLERFLGEQPVRAIGNRWIRQRPGKSQTLMASAFLSVIALVTVPLFRSPPEPQRDVTGIAPGENGIAIIAPGDETVDAGIPSEPLLELPSGIPVQVVSQVTPPATDVSPPATATGAIVDTTVINNPPIALLPAKLPELDGPILNEEVSVKSEVNEPEFANLRIEEDLNDSVVVSASAVAGIPFGVARIELQPRPDLTWPFRPDVPLHVTTDRGKAVHSAFEYSPPREASKNRPASPAKLICWFLFDHIAPTTVTLISEESAVATNVPLKMEPADDDAARARILAEWWKHYARFDLPHSSPELKAVNQYFKSMLARRLNMAPPVQRTTAASVSALESEFERTVGMLFGFESIRLAMMAGKTTTQAQRAEAAVQDLPTPLTINSVNIPLVTNDVRPESLAMRVPEECFYLRCFRVQNYHWIRNLVQGWGGSLDGIVATPAVDYRIREKIERQLALSTTELLKAAVDDQITDCALIGLDPFFSDGAALGVLFEEKTGGRLAEIISNERMRVKNAENGHETVVNIQGRSIQKLYTDHHQVRSFYVHDGKYHLVTNSEILARRFLETEAGIHCLGNLNEYRYSLSQSRQDKNSLAGLYLSDPFFRNITSPQCRIELERRRLACEDLFTLQTAHMAAAAEAIEDVSTNSLIRLGFLPEGFNQRPDHCTMESNQGEFYDSQRGVHGTFLPIADMAITRCTMSEWRAYEEFKRAYQQEWRNMDPVMLTFNRRPQTHPDRENVVLNIRITPYAQQEYRFLQQYLSSQPNDRRLAMSDDDLMAVSGQLTRSGRSYFSHIGLVDEKIPFEIRDGQIHRTGPNSKLSFARSNAFALVQPGGDEGIRLAVDFMRNVQRRQPTRENTEASGGTLAALINWILPIEAMINSAIREHSQSNQKATVLSMDSTIGRSALNQLKTENAPRPAQLFMQLRDVASSQVYEYLRAYTYVSSRQASADDAAALNRIAAMLQADPAEVRLSLEQSLGATFKCPAGGTYQLTGNGEGPEQWTSSAWQKPNLLDETAVPDKYRFPFLTWLRGMSLECSLTRTTLQSRLELDVARQTQNESALPPVEIVGTSR